MYDVITLRYEIFFKWRQTLLQSIDIFNSILSFLLLIVKMNDICIEKKERFETPQSLITLLP
jgi:hypothetical protein